MAAHKSELMQLQGAVSEKKDLKQEISALYEKVDSEKRNRERLQAQAKETVEQIKEVSCKEEMTRMDVRR